MNGLGTKRRNYSVALILLYIKCYETITPTTNSQLQKTYFIQKNTPWLIQYIGQSEIKPYVSNVVNIDSKYTEQNKTKNNLFNVHLNYNPKYTFEANKYKRNNEPYLKVFRSDSTEAFASNGVPKYIRKDKENLWMSRIVTVKPTINFPTPLVESKRPSEYYQTLQKNYLSHKIDSSLKTVKSKTIQENYWEPTRTPCPVLLSKWSRGLTRTSVVNNPVQNQKSHVIDDNHNGDLKGVFHLILTTIIQAKVHAKTTALIAMKLVRSWTSKPSTYTIKNQEPPFINRVKLFPETYGSLLSWREYDMRDINKTRQKIKRQKFQQVQPHRTILKSVLIL